MHWFFGVLVAGICIAIQAQAVERLYKACSVVGCRLCRGIGGTKGATFVPDWLRDWLGRATLSSRWQKFAPRWAQEGSRIYLARFCRCAAALSGPILSPFWAIFGPPWPFLGGPGGHLEADVGLGRLALGVQSGQQLRCQKHPKTSGKPMLWSIPECMGA